jgi:hypothetical protein
MRQTAASMASALVPDNSPTTLAGRCRSSANRDSHSIISFVFSKKSLTQRRKERKEKQKIKNEFLFFFALFAPLREVFYLLPLTTCALVP